MNKSLKLLFIFLPCLLFSQKEMTYWYFGEYAGIKFEDDGSVTQLSDGKLFAYEGCSAISDCNGDLLFYTDGKKVWDKMHNVMPNGTGLAGGDNSMQEAIIIKKPNSNTLYYLFTPGDYTNNYKFSYSIVDISLNGGLGDLTSTKNVQLIAHGTEGVGVQLHENGSSFWIVNFDTSSYEFKAFLLDSNGLNTTPVVSSFNYPISRPGAFRFSPDGSKLVYLNHDNHGIGFVGFDKSTGLLLNDYDLFTFGPSESPHGFEFSSSGHYLYVSTLFFDGSISFFLYQIDMTSPDLYSGIKTICHSYDASIDSLQRGNNGKIYCALSGVGLSVINFPDLPYNQCQYVHKAYSIKNCFLGLPYFYQYNSFDVENYCSGYATDFTLIAPNASHIVWDFGDGTTSTQMNPSHVYTTPGTYNVSVSGDVTGCLNKKIEVFQVPVVIAIPTQYICGELGESIILSQFDSLVLGAQSSTVFGIKYYDSLINCTNDVNSISGLNLNQNSIIYYKIYNIRNPKCFINSQFDVSLLKIPLFALNDAYFICDNSSIQVSVSNNFSSYHWSTGATSSSVQITQIGNYSVTVDQVYPNKTCSVTKNFEVLNSNAATITNVMVNDLTAEANSVMIEVTGDGNYEYAVDGSNYQISNVFDGLQPGSHTVYVMDTHNCGIVHQDFYIMEYPKFFTPNNDGNNDQWQIKYAHKQPDMMIVIYDRYGKIIDVFYGKDTGWNGTYNGNIMPSDDYWFVIKRKDKADVKGHFSLIR